MVDGGLEPKEYTLTEFESAISSSDILPLTLKVNPIIKNVIMEGDDYIVTSIGSDAFQYCSSLTSIDLSGCANLTSIGERAFADCSSLTSIEIPTSVKSIGNHAFYGCLRLISLDLSGCTSLESIGEWAFYYCSNLTSVDLSGCTSLESIGDRAFMSCSNLECIKIGATTPPTLGSYAFDFCDALATIYVPTESVETYKSASGWSSYSTKILGF